MTRYLEIKPGSLSEVAKKLHDDYQAYFKKELEKTGKSIAQMTDAEKKAFFNRVDKGYNAKNEQDDIKKAPGRHSQMKGKLLLEPQKEATSQDISASLATKPKAEPKTTMVVKPGAPKGQESVIRIPVEKLADYKKKGYIEAESYIPEQSTVKSHIIKYTNKDTGAVSSKTISGSDREDILKKTDEWKKNNNNVTIKSVNPVFKSEEKAINPYAIGMAAAMKATGDKPPLKKSTIVKAHDIAKKIEKNEEVEIKEAGMKEIDTTNQEIKRLRVRLQQLRDAENAAAGADTTNIEKQIHQTRSAILDLQKKQLQKQEDSDADKMNKKQKDVKGEEEVINKLKEGKMNYKSYKKSLKKEEVKVTENNSEDLYKKLGWNLNNKTYGATLTHSKHGVIEIDRYGEWYHKPKNISSTAAYKPIAFGKNNDLNKYISSLKEEKQIAEANKEKLSDQAKKQGLEYYGFGRYGKNKTVTHKSVNGNLQALPKNQQTKADDKESKPEKVDTVTDLKNTAKEVGFDDLNIEDDGKNISFVKEFDFTMDDEEDVKDEYNNIVKMLNKKGINYKPNFEQDVEIDNDQEYMQINFSVKKEQEDSKKMKNTMTGKPATKIDTEPKLAGHN